MTILLLSDFNFAFSLINPEEVNFTELDIRLRRICFILFSSDEILTSDILSSISKIGSIHSDLLSIQSISVCKTSLQNLRISGKLIRDTFSLNLEVSDTYCMIS